VQLALTNVVVQSIPDLSAGKVDDGKLTGLLGQAQSTAQGALDKAKGRMKEAAGALSGNEGRKARGQGDQVKGEARKKKGHLKDLFK